MSTITQTRGLVIGGVDTHAETHHAAVIDDLGRQLGDAEFPTTIAGCEELLAWLGAHGGLVKVGVEGTGSYGAGLARMLRTAGVEMVEVNRPDRRARRQKGKSDPLDAYAAARAALSGTATAVPKSAVGPVAAIRALHSTRAGLVRTRTSSMNQLTSMLITAPAELREQLRGLTTKELITTCAAFRRGTDIADPLIATKTSLRTLGRLCLTLDTDIASLHADLDALTALTAPGLRVKKGIGPESAAQLLVTVGNNPERLHSEAAFAALCGVSPIPASSGKTRRHRLNRGGDRQANRAIHTIALTRMRCDEKTRKYVARRTAEGLTKREIQRCIKRYIAREIFNELCRHAA